MFWKIELKMSPVPSRPFYSDLEVIILPKLASSSARGPFIASSGTSGGVDGRNVRDWRKVGFAICCVRPNEGLVILSLREVEWQQCISITTSYVETLSALLALCERYRTDFGRFLALRGSNSMFSGFFALVWQIYWINSLHVDDLRRPDLHATLLSCRRYSVQFSVSVIT